MLFQISFKNIKNYYEVIKKIYLPVNKKIRNYLKCLPKYII